MKQSMKIASYYALLIFLSLFLACNENEIADNENHQVNSFDKTELAFPNKFGETKKGFHLGMPITYQVIEGEYILDGDIILNKDAVSDSLDESEQKTSSKRSNGLASIRWPNNTVYYSIDPNLPNKYRVTDAIFHWESKTNLKFIKRANQTDYIYFYRVNNGCASNLGYQKGKQTIKLASGCTTGITIHEIGHAIGLFHEMSRSDRDSHIIVHEENIPPYHLDNFKKHADLDYEGVDYGAFDFNSIMMYGPKAFAINKKLPSITKKNGDTYKAQREALSLGDIAAIKIMYPSSNSGGTTGIKYQNGKDYTIHGIKVRRHNNQWWFYNGTNWKRVKLKGTSWEYI